MQWWPWVLLLGLMLDILGAQRLATGVMALQRQPADGVKMTGIQSFFTCTDYGFKSPEARDEAVAKAIQKGFRLLLVGFTLQAIATILSAWVEH